jgi:hypothetical protein
MDHRLVLAGLPTFSYFFFSSSRVPCNFLFLACERARRVPPPCNVSSPLAGLNGELGSSPKHGVFVRHFVVSGGWIVTALGGAIDTQHKKQLTSRRGLR